MYLHHVNPIVYLRKEIIRWLVNIG
jgi:hypothetical protein